MEPEGWAAVFVAFIAASGTVAVAFIARRTEKNTRPVSNGFADEVTGRLARIESLIVDHLRDHAHRDTTRL